MTVRKTAKGWQADFRPDGRGSPRIRKTFKNKRDAEAFETAEKAKALQGTYIRPSKDGRRLLDLVDDWYSLYGYTLKDGEGRKSILIKTCTTLGNPKAKNFSGEDFLRYRKERLNMKTRVGRKVSPNSVNHEHAYLSAVFGTLIKLKNWSHENPMKGIPKIKTDEAEVTYLETDQIKSLLLALENSRNKDVLVMTKLALSTGARWGELLALRGERIKGGKVHYVMTKSSKARAVPISEKLEKEIFRGRNRTGRLFTENPASAFSNAIDNAKINLPDGQLTHVLRHTFASHYIINDGNILKLKDLLGHKTLAMTMRYAKLAPKHLADAVEKNPLANLERPQSVHGNVDKPV